MRTGNQESTLAHYEVLPHLGMHNPLIYRASSPFSETQPTTMSFLVILCRTSNIAMSIRAEPQPLK